MQQWGKEELQQMDDELIGIGEKSSPASSGYASFCYGVQTRTIMDVRPVSEGRVVQLDTGIFYGSECFADAHVGDVYLVRLSTDGFAFGRIMEGIRMSDRKEEV